MATFEGTAAATPFGVFDDDTEFQNEADNMITFVKRKLGDDILSVELTKKQIWGNLEESLFEYGSILNQYQTKSQLMEFMGMPTKKHSVNDNDELLYKDANGDETTESTEEIDSVTVDTTPIYDDHANKFPRSNLEYLTRFAEPYAAEAGVGGSYDIISGSIEIITGKQDYNLNVDLVGTEVDIDGDPVPLFDGTQNKNPKTRLKINEVFHYSPQAAYRFFDTTSAVNYLNNEMSFESFTPETIFYVLPVFEDILRASQLDLSNRVRRSNYSYKVQGTNLRIYPAPTSESAKRIFVSVRTFNNPIDTGNTDETIDGVSNMGNIPFGNIQFSNINSIGHQWIRQMCLALSREQLGLIRSKFSNIPIPGKDLSLNGTELVSQGREDKKDLITQLKEMLDSMTYDKLIETQALRAENMQKQLKFIPMPNGKAVFMG
jgi:hypothetical protein